MCLKMTASKKSTDPIAAEEALDTLWTWVDGLPGELSVRAVVRLAAYERETRRRVQRFYATSKHSHSL